MDVDPEDVTRAARACFLEKFAQDPLVREHGSLAAPIAVREPGGGINSWFVGVTVGDRIVGFLQLTGDLVLMRASEFPRSGGAVEGCPPAALWLDPVRIAARARSEARAGDEIGPPYLTYDAHPTRLVWAVPVRRGRSQKTIFVAGEYAYVA